MIDDKIVQIHRLVLPEINQLMAMRYSLLATIASHGPIGRRYLAQTMDISERYIRNEIEFLQKQHLIKVERQGVLLTDRGKEIVVELKEMLYRYNGLQNLEKELCEKLQLEKAMIIPGDSESNHQVLQFMGAACSEYLKSILHNGDVMAMSGGASSAAVSEQMKGGYFPEVFIIPARGGIGRSHSTQANNVVAEMAIKLQSQYDLLHLPDNIDKELLEALKNYPEIKRVFDKMTIIDVLVFGIGRAEDLVEWRNLTEKEKQRLVEQKAVGEAFGLFFDIAGEVVSPSGSIGISLDDYKGIKHVIAISGGASKAEAIISISRIRKNMVLVTDESAANAILSNLNR